MDIIHWMISISPMNRITFVKFYLLYQQLFLKEPYSTEQISTGLHYYQLHTRGQNHPWNLLPESFSVLPPGPQSRRGQDPGWLRWSRLFPHSFKRAFPMQNLHTNTNTDQDVMKTLIARTQGGRTGLTNPNSDNRNHFLLAKISLRDSPHLQILKLLFSGIRSPSCHIGCNRGRSPWSWSES